MFGILFSSEELEHRLAILGEDPPIGLQWWEMPPERVAAAVVDHQDGTMSLYLLQTEEEFYDRPRGSRLVTLSKKDSGFQPQRRPQSKRSKGRPAPVRSNWARLSSLYQD